MQSCRENVFGGDSSWDIFKLHCQLHIATLLLVQRHVAQAGGLLKEVGRLPVGEDAVVTQKLGVDTIVL